MTSHVYTSCADAWTELQDGGSGVARSDALQCPAPAVVQQCQKKGYTDTFYACLAHSSGTETVYGDMRGRVSGRRLSSS